VVIVAFYALACAIVARSVWPAVKRTRAIYEATPEAQGLPPEVLRVIPFVVAGVLALSWPVSMPVRVVLYVREYRREKRRVLAEREGP
jgi:hypothetical protein